jgi:dihydroorotase
MDALILRGARVIDPSQNLDAPRDVLLSDGHIAGLLEPGTPAEGREIDVSGLIVAPGLVDIHVHLRQPGFEYKETIDTGAQAAVAGGITSVVAMPNTKPPPDTAEAVEGFYRLAEGAACRVYTLGAVTVGRGGTELAELVDLVSAGAVGFSDDGDPVADSKVMLNALTYSRMTRRPIASHCEDKPLASGGHMNEGRVSSELGISGIPCISETISAVRDIMLAEYAGAHLHICHVSAAGTVDAIREAKKRGKTRITGETAPHYLALTDKEVRSYSANTKMNPPLRTDTDREALAEALHDGTIDAIATDHAPHSMEEKQVEFDAAPFGIIGLETSLGVCWDTLVKPGILTPSQLIEKMSTNPAAIHDLPGGTLAEGMPADVVIIDPNREWTVPATFQSKAVNTPFVGRTLTGRAVMTIVGGDVRFDLDDRSA